MEESYEEFMDRYKSTNDDYAFERDDDSEIYSFEEYCEIVADPDDVENHEDWLEDAYEDYVNAMEG